MACPIGVGGVGGEPSGFPIGVTEDPASALERSRLRCQATWSPRALHLTRPEPVTSEICQVVIVVLVLPWLHRISTDRRMHGRQD